MGGEPGMPGAPGMPGMARPGRPGAPTEIVEEKKPPVPDDVTVWKTADYLQAKDEHDNLLAEAVEYLGKRFAGSGKADQAAALLTKLLERVEPEPEPEPEPEGELEGPPGQGRTAPPKGGRRHPSDEGKAYRTQRGHLAMPGDELGARPGPGGMAPRGTGRMGYRGGQRVEKKGLDSQTITAIVYALGANGSDPARQTLEKLLAGTFETDDNRTATEAALESLVDNPRPENEEILFRVLTAPEKIRAPRKKKEQPADEKAQQPPAEEAVGPSRRGQTGSSRYGRTGARRSGQTPSPGEERMTAGELQEMALSLIEPIASDAFRLKLAKYLVAREVPRPKRALLGNFLLESQAENVPAQVVFYLSDLLNNQMKEDFEADFTAYSSEAMEGILGIPDEPLHRPGARPKGRQPQGREEMFGGLDAPEEMPGGPRARPQTSRRPTTRKKTTGRPQSRAKTSGRSGRRSGGYGSGRGRSTGKQEEQAADPDFPYRLARQLWSPQFVAAIDARLEGVESLEEAAQLIMLASTMPIDSIRSRLHQTLQKHWTEGSGELDSAGLSGAVTSDPGFLILVKMLPRKQSAANKTGARTKTGRTTGRRTTGRRTTGRSTRGRSTTGRSRAGGGLSEATAKLADKAEETRKQSEQAGEDWMRVSEEFNRALCERLEAAAMAAAGKADRSNQSAGDSPVELHPDANIVAEYHLNWPQDVQKKLSEVAVGSTQLHYVRIEEKARFTSVLGYYRRKFTSCRTHEIEQGTWLDNLRIGADPGRKSSIDVFITKIEDDPDRPNDEEEELIVEILSIDVKDPAPEKPERRSGSP